MGAFIGDSAGAYLEFTKFLQGDKDTIQKKVSKALELVGGGVF